jgi:hypothetical protein
MVLYPAAVAQIAELEAERAPRAGRTLPLPPGPLEVGHFVWKRYDWHPDSPDANPPLAVGGVVCAILTRTDDDGTVEPWLAVLANPWRNPGHGNHWEPGVVRVPIAELDVEGRKQLGAAGLVGKAKALGMCAFDRTGMWSPLSSDLLGWAIGLLAVAGIRALPSGERP